MSPIPLLRDVLGEPAGGSESFARAIGPVDRKLLATVIGPGRPLETLPRPSPNYMIPRSAPSAFRDWKAVP